VPNTFDIEFQKRYVKALYPGCETISWKHVGVTRADRLWDGKKKNLPSTKGNPP